MKIRTYSELMKMKTFKDRYEYLKLSDRVGSETFGFDRIYNQTFYKSPEWLRLRDDVIIRDNGCDLGIEGREIFGSIYIHHMNPIRIEDIINRSEQLLNPEYLISSSFRTHNAIHYGDYDLVAMEVVDRKKDDTCPWRN